MTGRALRATLLIGTLLLGALLTQTVVAIDTDPKLEDPAQQATYERLMHEVRCLVCQNQTLGDSSAPLAADLRHEIRDLLKAGRSEDEIKSFLLERYGDFVLYKPVFKPSTAALWLAPMVLLLLGSLGLARILRRRATLPVPPDDDQHDDHNEPPAAAQG